MVYLIVAKYSDDAERKRIEYAIERWGDVMKLGRPDGVPIIIHDESGKVMDFLDDLYSRTSKDKVKIYNLSEASFEIEETGKHIKVELEGSLETVEKLVAVVAAKQNAIFKDEILSRKRYEVSTKKGRAEILTYLKPLDNKVVVDIMIKGYGEAPELVYNKISNELKYFKEV
ncbi:MAG: hypothetical protein Q8N79_09335 [Candidatus Methanoperedens sp.]|nr:hypothetical protein [Candidatus Methanoperedens sp.]